MKVKLEDLYPNFIGWDGFECRRKQYGERGWYAPGNHDGRFKRSDKIGTRFNNYIRGMRILLKTYINGSANEDMDDIKRGFSKFLSSYHDKHEGSACDRYDFGPWNTIDYSDKSISTEEIEQIGAGK